MCCIDCRLYEPCFKVFCIEHPKYDISCKDIKKRFADTTPTVEEMREFADARHEQLTKVENSEYRYEKQCEYCHKDFLAPKKATRFCSIACWQRYRSKMAALK